MCAAQARQAPPPPPTPPHKGRAIACGQFSANGRNIGIEIGSCAQLWNPAALSHARFESKISTCDCPALWGGVGGGGRSLPRQRCLHDLPPSPALPHQEGGSTPRLPLG